MKKQIRRQELQARYKKETVGGLAEQLNLTGLGLYKLLDSAGIERKELSKCGANRKKRTVYEIVD